MTGSVFDHDRAYAHIFSSDLTTRPGIPNCAILVGRLALLQNPLTRTLLSKTIFPKILAPEPITTLSF